MGFCHNCGHKLDLGVEKFCPNCGTNLRVSTDTKDGIAAHISGTSGDVIGIGLTGSGNITGKEVGYIIQGNVINLQISGNVSTEMLDSLQRIIAAPTQIEQASVISKATIPTKEEIKTKLEESTNTQQQIKSILEEVNNIGEKAGTEIQEIKVGDLQISKNELSLKEIILKGNEHYYKKEYEEAIRNYDKAIRINPKYAAVHNNKGRSLYHSKRYKEAIECSKRAVELDRKYPDAWMNIGRSLYKLGKYEEAIENLDKAVELVPHYAYALNKKGLALLKLGKVKEAEKYFNRAGVGI